MIVDYLEIGRNVKMQRIRKHLKQAQLAELVDVSAQHISHIECGRTKMGLPVLLGLADALSTDLYFLLGSNVENQQNYAVDAALREILASANPEQIRQCVELCRTAIEYGHWLGSR